MAKSPLPEAPSLLTQRLVSLDQFRGYTVAGMFLVNFLGKFDACPEILKHHNTYNSYADTIMPGFFMAVGFAFRLTFGRRAQEQGLSAAYQRVVRRFLGLALFAIFWYGHDGNEVSHTWKGLTDIGFWTPISASLKRDWFQTLLHIAVTGLWLTPVIRSGAMVRILYMIGSAALHVYLSYLFAFKWNNHGGNVIDGGPLGFLTWTIPAMVGTLACDAVVNRAGRPPLVMMSIWAILLMVLGYGFSCGTRLYDLPPKAGTEQLQKLDHIKSVSEDIEKQLAALPQTTDSPDAQRQKLDGITGLNTSINEQIADLNQPIDSVEAHKEKIKLIGGVHGLIEKQIAAARQTIDLPSKRIAALSEELAKLKKEALLAKYREVEKEVEPGFYVKRRLINQAEAEVKANPTPRMTEIEAEIDGLKEQWRFSEVEALVKDLNRRRGDIVDPKLAPDAVVPMQSRIDAARKRYEEQHAKAILAEAPFIPPPGDDKRVDPPPHVDYRQWNYWMMSQRAGTISYLTFAAGFNLLVYVLFYILGDMLHASVGVFRTLGTNALAGYMAHDWVGGLVKQYMPQDIPALYMWIGFAIFFYITYLFIRTLEKQKIFLRL